MKLLVLAAAASLGMSAAPLVYTETSNGDLYTPNAPGASSALTVLTLGSGANTISGTFGTGDFDSFAILIPAGLTFESGNVQLADGLGDVVLTSWSIRNGSTYGSGTAVLPALTANSPGTAALTGLPLGPGTYSFSHGSVNSIFNGGPVSADYTFTLNLTGTETPGVPEPSTVVLAAAALAGMAVARRRR